jgi:hypothetical protein
MKIPFKMAIVGGLAALLLPTAAQAGWHGRFGFSIGVGPGCYAPYCYAPAVTYCAPPVVYAAPVYQAPVYAAPAYCPPVAYSAPAVVYSAPAVVYDPAPVVYGPSIVVSPSFGFYGGHYRSYTHFGYHRR